MHSFASYMHSDNGLRAWPPTLTHESHLNSAMLLSTLTRFVSSG